MGTRRAWTPEQKLAIVLEGLTSGNVAALCRTHELSPTAFQRWREEALDGARRGLRDKRAPTNRDPQAEEIRTLRELVGKQALILELQKKVWGERLA